MFSISSDLELQLFVELSLGADAPFRDAIDIRNWKPLFLVFYRRPTILTSHLFSATSWEAYHGHSLQQLFIWRLAMAQFRPRNVFHELPALPRTFYLGHHRAGLQKMKTLLSNVDLIVECRDRRVPLTSRNPALERGLQYDQSGRRERLIIYTKSGLVQEDAKVDLASLHPTVLSQNANTPLS